MSEKRALLAKRERVTERDRQLMMLLAMVRHLTTDQLLEIAFRGRHRDRCVARLRALCGEGVQAFRQAYLRRIHFRSQAGHGDVAWALTPLGYWIASQASGKELKPPRKNGGDEFLDHNLTLNNLFVQLAAPWVGADGCVDVRRLPFRWVSSESVRLPWQEYSMDTGKTYDRLIVPDALLEFPGRRRRFFVECEMGTHSLEGVSDEKTGTTVKKLERYDAFINGFVGKNAGATFYSKAFEDGWTPEVLFLVRTESRMSSIHGLAKTWAEGRAGRPLRLSAVTLDAAKAQLLPELGAPVAAPDASSPSSPGVSATDGVVLTSEEARLLVHCFNNTIARFKDVRAEARTRGLSPPEYPADIEQFRALVLQIDARRRSV